MKIQSIRVVGYRCLRDVTIHPARYSSLIGRNDAGKSAFLRAIEFLFDPGKRWTEVDTCKLEDWGVDEIGYVEAVFEECTGNFLHEKDGRARLRRLQDGTYETDGLTPSDPNVAALLKGISKANYRDSVTENSPLWTAIPEPIRDKARWSSGDARDAYRSLVEGGLVETTPGVATMSDDEVSDYFDVFFLGADVRGADEAGSATGMYAKLSQELLSRALETDEAIAGAMKVVREKVGELTRTDEATQKVQYEPLQSLADDLTAELQKFNPMVTAAIAATAAQVTMPKLSSTLTVTDGLAKDISRFGHGLQRTAVLALLTIAMKMPDMPVGAEGTERSRFTIILVEEPELYLHPQAERERMCELTSLAESSKLHVFTATHSAFFVDVKSPHGIKIVTRRENAASVVRERNPSNAFDPESQEAIKLIQAINPSVAAMFFADKIILGEGLTERVAVPEVAKRLGLRSTGLEVVDAGGASCVLKLQKFLEDFGLEYVALYDWDQSKEDAKKGWKLATAGKGKVVVLQPNWEGVAEIKTSNDEKPLKSYQKFSQVDAVVPDELKRVITAALDGEFYAPAGHELLRGAKKDPIDSILNGDGQR